MTTLLTSLQHPLVKHLVKLRTDSTYRNDQQTLVIEGVKPLLELSVPILHLLYTAEYKEAAAQQIAQQKWEITPAILHKISSLPNPEGMLAEVQQPAFGLPQQVKSLLVLDGVSDPGNLGTLLRTALAFGWEGVYFLPGGCDPFNEKVLRAARGAHFKLILAKGTPKDLQHLVQTYHFQSLVADLTGDPPAQIKAAERRLLILGNEAHGPSAFIKRFSTAVTLPIRDSMESLNVAVAGGILLYTLQMPTQLKEGKEA